MYLLANLLLHLIVLCHTAVYADLFSLVEVAIGVIAGGYAFVMARAKPKVKRENERFVAETYDTIRLKKSVTVSSLKR